MGGVPVDSAGVEPLVVRDIEALRAAIADACRTLGERVGFVPTMGSLHDGHGQLVQHCCAENDVTVVSIFVNPSQFNSAADLSAYPRDEARDIALLAADGVQIVFAPTAEVMYPPGFSTWVTVDGISEVLEGEFRPGHFRGVATVVARLLRAVRPARAYFGEKDWQQLLVVRQLVRDLLLDVDIIGVPTVREADGLAMSSRNVRLSDAARTGALAISAAIRHAQESCDGGVTQVDDLEARLQAALRREPAVTVDYAVVVDAETLRPITHVARPARALVAAHVGGVRLIDNGAIG